MPLPSIPAFFVDLLSLPMTLSIRHTFLLTPLLFLITGLFPLQASPKPQLDLLEISLSLGTNSLSAQIAADEPARERGLMNRTNLSDGEGMLFVFPGARPVTFWMKNTPLPLSIAYISNSGRILETHDMKPHPQSSMRWR